MMGLYIEQALLFVQVVKTCPGHAFTTTSHVTVNEPGTQLCYGPLFTTQEAFKPFPTAEPDSIFAMAS